MSAFELPDEVLPYLITLVSTDVQDRHAEDQSDPLIPLLMATVAWLIDRHRSAELAAGRTPNVTLGRQPGAQP